MYKKGMKALQILDEEIENLEDIRVDVKGLNIAFEELEKFYFSAINKIEELEGELEMYKDNC